MYIKDIVVGFEVECFIHKHNFRSFLQAVKPKIQKHPFWWRQRTLEAYLNEKTTARNLKYIVIDDGSIESDHNDYTMFEDFEIITTPLPLERALDELQLLFEFLDKWGFETNFSTGLHVNMSFTTNSKYSMDDVSPSLLFASLNEKALLKRWNRLGNMYCMPFDSVISRELTSHPEYGIRDLDCALIRAADRECRSTFSTKYKYRTVSITKLLVQKYLEFRAIGGTEYHRKFDRIELEIRRFARAMYKSAKYSRDDTKDLGRVVAYATV